MQTIRTINVLNEYYCVIIYHICSLINVSHTFHRRKDIYEWIAYIHYVYVWREKENPFIIRLFWWSKWLISEAICFQTIVVVKKIFQYHEPRNIDLSLYEYPYVSQKIICPIKKYITFQKWTKCIEYIS